MIGQSSVKMDLLARLALQSVPNLAAKLIAVHLDIVWRHPCEFREVTLRQLNQTTQLFGVRMVFLGALAQANAL